MAKAPKESADETPIWEKALSDIPELSPDELAVLTEYRKRSKIPKTRERCTASLYEFTKEAWEVLEPDTPLVLNWHIELLCKVVQRVLENWVQWRKGGRLDPRAHRHMQNVVINIPPGTAKSRILQVMAPAWMWIEHPGWRLLAFSGNESIAARDASFRRDLINSEWYQKTFKPEWKLKDDQNAKLIYGNTAGGYHIAKTAGQRVTGERADAIFIDDPNDAATVGREEIRKQINILWWDQSAANRVNSVNCSVRIGIMQRLHVDDWSGHVLSQKNPVTGEYLWDHLSLPQEYVKDGVCSCGRRNCTLPALGLHDPRTKDGELLFPQRFPQRALDEERARLGEVGYAGQHQQHPYALGGSALRREWFRFYQEDPQDLPFEFMYQTWDMTFKDTARSDFVCGQVWGIRGNRRYLVDQYHGRADFIATLKAVKVMSTKWPKAKTIYIEDKANGTAVIRSLRDQIAGIVAVTPKGSKTARASAVSPLIESGCVYLPDPKNEPWVEGFLAECEAFPNGAHDDRVDAMTQGLTETISLRFDDPEEPKSEVEQMWEPLEREVEIRQAHLRGEALFDDLLDEDTFFNTLNRY